MNKAEGRLRHIVKAKMQFNNKEEASNHTSILKQSHKSSEKRIKCSPSATSQKVSSLRKKLSIVSKTSTTIEKSKSQV